MTWSPDGRTIVLGTKDDFASHVDVEAQRVTSRQKAEHEVRVYGTLRICLADLTRFVGSLQINEAIFSHNGTLLLTATDGYAQIAAFPSGEEIHRVNISTIMTTVMDLDPRGRYVGRSTVLGRRELTLTLLFPRVQISGSGLQRRNGFAVGNDRMDLRVYLGHARVSTPPLRPVALELTIRSLGAQ